MAVAVAMGMLRNTGSGAMLVTGTISGISTTGAGSASTEEDGTTGFAQAASKKIGRNKRIGDPLGGLIPPDTLALVKVPLS